MKPNTSVYDLFCSNILLNTISGSGAQAANGVTERTFKKIKTKLEVMPDYNRLSDKVE